MLPKFELDHQSLEKLMISVFEKNSNQLQFSHETGKWNQDKILNLLTSILKGYPIGEIILWKSPNHNTQINTVGRYFLESTGNIYILDGNERIGVLASCLFDVNPLRVTKVNDPVFNKYKIWYDYKTNQLSVDETQTSVLLSKIYHGRQIFDLYKEIEDSPTLSKVEKNKALEKLQDIHNIFRLYLINTVTLRLTENELKDYIDHRLK